MKNKVLVLGGNGMAGHIISLYLNENNYDVTTLCRKYFYLNDDIKNIIWDENFETLETIINAGFDVIINCIGILNSVCDKNPKNALKINSFLPHFINKFLINKKTKLIHLSTDCVFSGKNPPYNELSIPDGSSIYDITKATGEFISGENVVVLRNSIIGPDINKNGTGLFNWFMKQNEGIIGYDNWIWSGITTLELAKQIDKILKNDLIGFFQLTNNTSISKYSLLILFNEITNKKIIITKNSLQNKIDKTLINTVNNNSFNIPDYKSMIIEMYNWILKHKEVYDYE